MAEILVSDPEQIGELINCLWDSDPLICMRAADAAEKASRQNPALLQPFKAELLSLLAEAVQQELRWHLAQMVPRLRLTANEAHLAAEKLQTYLEDRSSIVKTFAMQGLYELSCRDSDLRPMVGDIIRDATRSGTPAMRARGRKLLRLIDSDHCQNV